MQGVAIGFARRLLRNSSLLPNRAHWICSSCQRDLASRARVGGSFANVQGRGKGRGFSSSLSKNAIPGKPYYITTPIFYVNASPHVGHFYTMVLADVLKRWEVLKDEGPAYLCTGTDEHGMKVQQAADQQDVAPKTLCDNNAEIFKDLAKKANLSHDHFIRTTDPDHRLAVEFFWDRLRDNGYIYETKHEGWYCVSDETFYPENMVEKQISPKTGKAFTASIETGNAVEWTEERNYHFRMTALRDRLLDFYKENPQWVVPASRMAEVVDWVENHLEDLSISRPRSRLEWGIAVPDDPSQTIYVWVDALINYLTFAGYPNWTPGSEHLGGWPADVHVIGKDIVRFHCVYWPALLMALDLPLPKRVLSHAHWLMNSKKMSKSIGNVVNPFFAIDRWGVDTMRYFLMYNGGIEQDSNYNNALIVDRYKKGLQGGLGNLLNRVTRAKKWSVPRAIQYMHEQVDLSVTGLPLGAAHTAMMANVVSHMEKGYPGTALKTIMAFVFETNKYLAEAEPWNLAAKDASHEPELNQIVYTAAESLRITGILLQPFMPDKMAQLLDRLGVDPAKRTLKHAKMHADPTYGTPRIPLGEGALSSLFPPFPVET